MKAIASLSAGVLLLLAPVQEALVYRAPDGSTPEGLAKSAQAMAARCKSYGYKGIVATPLEKPDRKLIQLSCETGFTPEMKLILDTFAQLACASVEIRFTFQLSEIEKEQYQAGKDPAADKAPNGARWFRFLGSEGAPILLRDVPVILKSDILSRQAKDRSGALQWVWEVNSQKTREILEIEKRKGKLGTPVLIVDGWAVEAIPLATVEKNEEGKLVPVERAGFSPALRAVREALVSPMPFPLERED